MPVDTRPVALVVDDDAAVRSTLTIALEHEYAVVPADGGPAALGIVTARPIDVALVDVVMPDMNGLELLRRLKTLDATLPVVLVSGLSDVPTVVHGMKLGAFDYVTKPWDLAGLRATVRRAACQRHRGTRSVLVVDDDPPGLAPIALAIELALGVPTTLVMRHELAVTDPTPALVIVAERARRGVHAGVGETHVRFADKPVVDVPTALVAAVRGDARPATHLAPWPVADLLRQVGRALERGEAATPRRPPQPHAWNAVDYIRIT